MSLIKKLGPVIVAGTLLTATPLFAQRPSHFGPEQKDLGVKIENLMDHGAYDDALGVLNKYNDIASYYGLVNSWRAAVLREKKITAAHDFGLYALPDGGLSFYGYSRWATADDKSTEQKKVEFLIRMLAHRYGVGKDYSFSGVEFNLYEVPEGGAIALFSCEEFTSPRVTKQFVKKLQLPELSPENVRDSLSTDSLLVPYLVLPE